MEIRRLLEEAPIEYHVPQHLSLVEALRILGDYLAEASGGLRPQIFAFALFKVLGEKFKLFDKVVSGQVTASNLMRGRVADVECYKGERIELAVSVKDIELTEGEILDQIEKCSSASVSRVLFMAFRGMRGEEALMIKRTIEERAESGIDAWVMNLENLDSLGPLMLLLGEEGRKQVFFPRKEFHNFPAPYL